MKKSLPTPASPVTQQDSTYATLRQWITVGKFLPGERLKIRNIAQALGTSTMPVRAALLRLAAEGALTHSPNRGVAVPRLSKAEFDDVLQNRLLLEGEAAERGALRLGTEDRKILREYTDAMRQALEASDAKTYLDVNELFHLRLYRAAGSPTLLQLIETVWLRVGPLSNQLFAGNDGAGALNDAHEDLVRALDRSDAGAARRAIERDLFVAGQFLRKHCTV